MPSIYEVAPSHSAISCMKACLFSLWSLKIFSDFRYFLAFLLCHIYHYLYVSLYLYLYHLYISSSLPLNFACGRFCQADNFNFYVVKFINLFFVDFNFVSFSISILTHWLFRSTLFSLYLFVFISVFFL